MAEDKELVEALDKISDAIGQSGATKRGFAPDLKGACQKYKTIRPMLERTLPLIDKVPVYGSKIAIAIRFLMGVADVACPTV